MDDTDEFQYEDQPGQGALSPSRAPLEIQDAHSPARAADMYSESSADEHDTEDDVLRKHWARMARKRLGASAASQCAHQQPTTPPPKLTRAQAHRSSRQIEADYAARAAQ